MPAPQKQDEEADPTPYLFISLEQKRIDQSKPYDAKKACWIPDEKEGYLLGEIKATKGDIVSVGLPGGEVCIPPSLIHSRMHSGFSKFLRVLTSERRIRLPCFLASRLESTSVPLKIEAAEVSDAVPIGPTSGNFSFIFFFFFNFFSISSRLLARLACLEDSPRRLLHETR